MFKILATAYLFIWIGFCLADVHTTLPQSYMTNWDGVGIVISLSLFVILGYLAGKESNVSSNN